MEEDPYVVCLLSYMYSHVYIEGWYVVCLSYMYSHVYIEGWLLSQLLTIIKLFDRNYIV